MRTTLISLSIAALLAVGAGSAAADPWGVEAGAPGRALAARSEGLQRHYVGRNEPLQHRYVGRDLVAVAPATQVVATHPARSGAPPAAVAESGFDWGDAMIGAGLLAALLGVSAGALTLVRRERPVAAR
jgi:hypothetical protein